MARHNYRYDSENELKLDIIDCSIHDKLTFDQIEELHTIFKNNKTLNYADFRQTLELFNIQMSDEQYKKLFLKININSNTSIDWDELISYMIFCFKQDDSQSQKDSLILPISGEPIIKKGCHKTPIIGISLMQSLLDDDGESFGSYLTCSKDGFINFWSSEFEITKSGTSKSQYLEYTPTWVLSIVALSDIRVICVSSTERELRFYDVMATNFHLRLVICSVPCAICKLNYFYTTSQLDVNSKILMGDMNGSAYTIEFSPIMRGPFQSKAGSMLMEFTWIELLKKKFPAIIATEYQNLFNQYITDIAYSLKFDTLFVCAEGYGYSGGVISIDGRGVRNHFYMPQGVSSISLDDQRRILATGGPDSYIRLWDPLIPAKASAVLSGHHAGIIYIFIQGEESKCYSIDKAKIIKVWHIYDLTLLQTYSDLTLIIPNEQSLCYLYNKVGHELLIGGRKLTSIKCCFKIKLELTDGYTHTAAISVVLYNYLFENIVTCGLDSYIIVWDIWTGRRQLVMKGCHTQDVMGVTINLEITAATFDPSRQLLLTGARDGSLKIWNYNNAVCVRNMRIEKDCEVTAVVWLVDRILAIGWNRRVTEFGDSRHAQYTDPKQWYRVHLNDVSAAAYKIGETLVSGSSDGELIFWRIETGQPYRKYDVAQPLQYIPLVFDPLQQAATSPPKRQPKINIAKLVRHSVSKIIMTSHFSKKLNDESDNDDLEDSENIKKNIKKKHIMRRLDSKGIVMPLPPVAREPSELLKLKIGIQAILLLKTRPYSKEHGTVFVSLDNGYLQVYSHHQLGGFMKEFYIIHKSGDCCLSMATDRSNKYLFTGTAFGYLKVWLLQNFCIPESEHTHVSMPMLRLQFLFLSNDRVMGRAKRVARQKEPLLLNSYKAHLSAITSIVYIEHSKILITGSNDYSVRMWTLGGRYLGTLGSHIPITQIKRNESFNDDNQEFRVPPDINKVASSTTMKVLTGQTQDGFHAYMKKIELENLPSKRLSEEYYSPPSTVQSFSKHGKSKSCHITTLKEPLLGKQFKFHESYTIKNKSVLDKNLPHIPVYTHLKIHDAKIIQRPRTPENLKKIKNLNFMSYYQGKKMNT